MQSTVPKRFLYPASKLLDAAAQHVISTYEATLPHLNHITIILPNLYAAQDFARALVRNTHCATLLLPKLTTFQQIAKEIHSNDYRTFDDSARELALYQTLQKKDWFKGADLWVICSELVNLFNDINRYQVSIPDSYQDFLIQLANAYNMRATQPLQFEARLAHELWYALQTSADNQLDSVSYYHKKLALAAEQASTPLYVLDTSALTRAEEQFIDRYALRQPVYRFGIAENATDDTLSSLLKDVWSTITADSQQRSSLILKHGNLRQRAKEFAKQQPQDPLAGRVAFFGAHNLEQEAAAIDFKIREWLSEGYQRIGVVVQDRLVARRARALLERAQVLVEDETGWTFSTASASAIIARWIDAISNQFNYQDLLDLLKSPFIFHDWDTEQRSNAVYRLEKSIRENNVMNGLQRYTSLASKLQENGTKVDVMTMLQRLSKAASLFDRTKKSMSEWVSTLMESLKVIGARDALAQDQAGNQLLQLLSELQLALEQDANLFTFNQWRRWLKRQLEQATFRDTSISSPVVFTHLAATRLRNFDGVILIGCDTARLPADEHDGIFFNQAVRAQLGLPTFKDKQVQINHDLISLFSLSKKVFITWQAVRNNEPNLLSPYFSALQTYVRIAYESNLADKIPEISVPHQRHAAISLAPPAPHVTDPILLPATVSVSALNSLVACPYQFYARHILGLATLDEVSETMEKKDYGQYIHQILYQFHQKYPYISERKPAQIEEALHKISEDVFTEAIKLNFLNRAWLVRWQKMIPSYIAWQLQREHSGWRFHAAEQAREIEITLGDGTLVKLKGRLDRVDMNLLATNQPPTYAVIDYKTQSKEQLKGKIDDLGEDLQLPAYALLYDGAVSQTAYLSLHKDEVEQLLGDASLSKAETLEHLRQIFAQLYSNAALPAHGANDTCEFCEMRGLCRKDYWAE